MKDLKRAVLITIILVSGFLSGCSSWSRMGKSISSDMKGGLNRTVTLYDYNGEEIRHWSGKFLKVKMRCTLATRTENVLLSMGVLLSMKKIRI